MQFPTLTVMTMALSILGSALAGPVDASRSVAERSASPALSIAERAEHHGITYIEPSPLEKRACNCAGVIKCLPGCKAFNNASGQAGGFCAMSCYSANGCGQNTLCCKDGRNCVGKGCCA